MSTELAQVSIHLHHPSGEDFHFLDCWLSAASEVQHCEYLAQHPHSRRLGIGQDLISHCETQGHMYAGNLESVTKAVTYYIPSQNTFIEQITFQFRLQQ